MFAFFPHNTFIRKPHALALIRFRRVKGADLRSNLSDHLTVRAFDSELSVFLNRHFDLGRNRINHGMRIAETQVDGTALYGGFEADALDFEFLDKAFAD